MKSEQMRVPAAGGKATHPEGLLLKTSVGILALVMLLFIPAGTLNRPSAWVYLAFYAAWAYSCVFLLGLPSPALMVMRSVLVDPPRENRDKVFSVLFSPLVFTLIIVSSFKTDGGGDLLSLSGNISGFIGLACAYALAALSLFTDNSAASGGQPIPDRGPYAMLRHPIHLAAICFFLCTPAALGSFAGFVPACVLAACAAVAASADDRFKLGHLPGYVQYAARVRYRLIPKVW